VLLLWLLSGAATTALGQANQPPECSQDEKFINTWYFGYKAGLNFNEATDSIPPKVLTDSRMVAPAGSGVMSDGSGNLLFYTNGDTIWSRNHSVMVNGTGLGGNPLCTDGPLIIKAPRDLGTPASVPIRYYLFTQDAQGGPKGLSYSTIDLATGQQGEVLAATKNTPLAKGTAEKMTAVFDKNGCDIWVIVHGWGPGTSGNDNRGDSFLAFHVTQAGVQPTPVVSTLGFKHTPSIAAQGYRGQMKVSPEGQQLAVARFSETLADSSSSVELFAFDAGTGQVSGRKVLDTGAGRYYGVEFLSGRLFATVQNPPQLLQFDLNATNIAGSKVSVPLRQKTPANLGSLQAASDGKIYVARENQPALGVISLKYVDSLATTKVKYADDTLALGGRRSGLGLPNFNQSSLLRVGFGAQSTACFEQTFQAGSPVPNPQSYAWNFGDPGSGANNISAAANPKHQYPGPGTYNVTLRITNFCFCREITSQINVPGPPLPGSIGPAQTLCAGSAAAPIASTAPASQGTGEFSYQWQSSTDNANWTDIGGATGLSYAPGALGATTYFRRLVTSGFCSPRTPTASVAITVLPALTAGTIAADQTICAVATPAPLTSGTAATGGSGSFTYRWESSVDNVTWTTISAAVSEGLVPGPLTTTTYFRRRVASGPCTALSNTVTITVTPPVLAGTIAADQALCAGVTPAPLTSATPATGGTGGVAYQWESSTDNTTWTAIGGATGATYAPGALNATTYFRRRASATGACAPAVSNVVTITVAPVLAAGSIGSDQTVCVGTIPSPLTSGSAATGTSNITYQWESSADNTTWVAIGGATGDTFAPGALTATTYFRRRASASGACAPVVSNVVAIIVTPNVAPGTIAASQTLCAGSTPAPFTSTAPASGGSGGIAYQWESSADNSTWAAIGGATGDTYAPGALTATTYYRRRAGSGSACAPVYSNTITVTVAPALTAGTIGTDQTICPGTAPAGLTSTADPTGGSGGYSYQWESSPNNSTWTAIGGATGASYAPGALTTTTYYRRQVISGPCGPVYSPSVAITVLPALNPGSIAADQSICANSTPSPLTSQQGAAGGSGGITYQWESSADNANWAAISGATSDTYAPGALTATTYYRRRVTSGTGTCSTGVSNTVTVQVQPLVTPTVSLATPPTQCAGTPLTFTAVTTNVGTAPTFQWFVNNTAVASGPTFTSSTLATGDQVRVTVTATAGLCNTGPATATVTVTRTPTPTPSVGIGMQPAVPVCPGEPITFSITTVTDVNQAPTYQWQVNGNNVAGATSPVFTSTTLRDAQVVTLRLSTTTACGQPITVVSNGANVRILPPVVVDAGPDKEILEGSSVKLEGSANGVPVTWTPALGLTIPANDPLHPIASPAVTTTYTLTAGSGGCASSDQVTVTVRPAIRIPNAFSPNGDGNDDTWQIDFIEQYENTVTVFNRWGNQIFSTSNYSRSNEWRGDINGQPAPIGTYYYVIVTKGPLGRSYSGSITVVY